MKPTLASIVIASLLLAACAREQTNSDGNGTGTADGAGGRQDPPTAPEIASGQSSSDRSTNDQSAASGNAESAGTPPQQPSQQ